MWQVISWKPSFDIICNPIAKSLGFIYFFFGD